VIILHVLTSDPSDLDLKPSESKISRGHVFMKTSQHVKYDSSMIDSSQEKEWIPLFTKKDPCDLDP